MKPRTKLRILLTLMAPVEIAFCVVRGMVMGFDTACDNLRAAWDWELPPRRPQDNRLNRRISKWMKED